MARKTTISKLEAFRLAKKAGIKFSKSSYEQSSGSMAELVAIAKLAGYRKPKNASGSTGRYFFDHLDRMRKKKGWK